MKDIVQSGVFILCFFCFVSCKTGSTGLHHPAITSQHMIVLKGNITYDVETVFDKEVTIYPETFLKTTGNGKLIFTKKVNILGESQVFDENIDIHFAAATINVLNPCWFGAKGYDDLDDTKAFRKALKLAHDYTSSVNITIPIGKFRISETLELGNDTPTRKSINLTGTSMSINSTDGSALLWTGLPGKSLLIVRNYCAGRIENLDFSALSSNLLKHNIELLPLDYQVLIENCSFAGCAGPGSANVNINNRNSLMVSEVYFRNCVFRGYTENGKKWDTESAVIGGAGNTKNFSFELCSLLGYSVGAINIDVSDIVRVENCTFAFNEIDIICMLCNAMITGNYSEHSKSFFLATVSINFSFTTMMNNCFYGSNDADYIIREGAGNLVLINNNFGGMGGNDPTNRVRWQQSVSSNIHSIGNFFRNNPGQPSPFYQMQNDNRKQGINSYGDFIGTDGFDVKELIIKKP